MQHAACKARVVCKRTVRCVPSLPFRPESRQGRKLSMMRGEDEERDETKRNEGRNSVIPEVADKSVADQVR